VGLPGRSDRRADLLLITTPSQIPDHWWGPFAIWDGGLGIWGGIAAASRRVSGICASTSVAGRLRASWTPHARPAGRAGDRPDRQLLQPGAVRQALDAALGAQDLPGAPPARLRAVRHLPADVPVRDHLEPVAGGFLVWLDNRDGSGRRGCSRCTSPATRASASSRRRCGSTTRSHILGMRLNFWIALIGTLAGLIWFVRIQRSRPLPGAAAGSELRQLRPRPRIRDLARE
jgi:hypothetical protein